MPQNSNKADKNNWEKLNILKFLLGWKILKYDKCFLKF